MFAFLRALTGAIVAALSPRASLVAENLAPRQQLAVLRLTSSPKVWPGEHPHAAQTEHSRAPYTDRVLFVETATRAAPRQFQGRVALTRLRSHRSPKFVRA
jgi:hypothetical protein